MSVAEERRIIKSGMDGVHPSFLIPHSSFLTGNKMIKAILFDLDHTLYDRHGTLTASVPLLRRTFEVNPALSDAEVADIWCRADDHNVYDGWAYIFAQLCEEGVFVNPPDYADYRSLVFRAFGSVAVRFDHVLPMLRTFKRQGYLVGLITNGRHELQYAKLEMTGLRYIFDEILVSGDCGCEKPDKEIFLAACEKLGITPEEAVYVGDNRRNDVDGAKGAGMRAVWLCATNDTQTGRCEPDATIRDLRELPETVKVLSAGC